MRWSIWRRYNYTFFKEHLASLESSARLLDLGAGPRQFRDLFDRFVYTGVDFEPYEGVSVVCDITKEWPFENASFDVVTASNVFEHLAEPYDVAQKIHRVLRPGGVVLGTVPFVIKLHQTPHDYFRYTEYGLRHIFRDFTGSVLIVPLGNELDTIALTTHLIEKEMRRSVRTSYWFALQKFARLFRPAMAKDSSSLPLGYGFILVK